MKQIKTYYPPTRREIADQATEYLRQHIERTQCWPTCHAAAAILTENGYPCSHVTAWKYLKTLEISWRSKMATQELLTIKELAARLRLHPGTVRAWWRKGFIPGVSIGRRFLRFDCQEVIETLKNKGLEKGLEDKTTE